MQSTLILTLLIASVVDGFSMRSKLAVLSPQNTKRNGNHNFSGASGRTACGFRNFHRKGTSGFISYLSLDVSNEDSFSGENENENEKSDEDDSNTIARFDAEQLSNRIRKVEQSESEVTDRFTSGLQQRVRELRSAKAIEDRFLYTERENRNQNSSSNTTTTPSTKQESQSRKLFLPVICFDALLPNQKLEGSTQDPTFIRFLLEETGLGGWFVMVSFEYRSRKVRRNGVLCKVEFLDAAAKPDSNNSDASDRGYGAVDDHRRIPTSVSFVIVGKRRCRVEGDENGLQARIGRWRRQYDENGEESVLGWGLERFTDLLPAKPNAPATATNKAKRDRLSQSLPPEPPPAMQEAPKISSDPTQWSSTEIATTSLDGDEDATTEPLLLQKAESLIPLVEEWYGLASNVETYRNTNVTVSARVARDQPMLRIDPAVLLARVLGDLEGDQTSEPLTTTQRLAPDPAVDPNGFAFWVGALLNPLPPLGVALELRGNLLEVRTLGERLEILEKGLLRSIENLRGERPL